MNKTHEQLEKEYAETAAKLEKYQHQQQRLKNRVQYYQQGDRKKRTHRLITRGAAVESVAPEVRDMNERTFYLLVEQIFSLPEIRALVSHVAEQREGN